MGSRNLVLSDGEILDAIELYKNGESGPAIAKKYGVYPNSIYGLIKRRGVKTRCHSEAHRKYFIDEDFLDDIDSEEKAYFMGLFYADGSNNVSRGKAYIKLAESDKEILLKLRSIVQPDKPLWFGKRDNPNHQDQWMLYFDNKKFSNRLSELGCCTNKTHKIKFPTWIDDRLCSHFIRGYFDGDGHVGIYNNRAAISIVGTEDFCMSIVNILSKINININKLYDRHKNGNNTRSIQFGGNRQVARFLNWMYKDATIYMERKFIKYNELLELNGGDDEKTKRSMGLSPRNRAC